MWAELPEVFASVLVIYGRGTNSYKFSELTQHAFIVPHFLWVSWVLCPGSHKSEIKVIARLLSHLEVHLGKGLLLGSLRLLEESIAGWL